MLDIDIKLYVLLLLKNSCFNNLFNSQIELPEIIFQCASGQLELSDVLWTFIFIFSSDIWTSSSNTSDSDKHNPESQDKLSQMFRANGSEQILYMDLLHIS